ncbi:TetR/AcrR family transcriptional regulator [Mycobacterium sp. Aquia_216]|uniref:TetR/AcrR family transcriptional regulator n=1 Tax=Mycobacterium sp. Aquia_216 TaxID=2991729 RepID=UPI00227D4E68|nr:TetR/AcrR family transcriptional regulator [Mycobacterium sp. Aquia_216]WAJ45314.1 TetR/AcrR family transcriptional regulator [Mycobacterium sp. Aquia_216]
MPKNALPARVPAGPTLQLEVTEAIRNAFFEELADVGFGRLSIDAVARRAGVGKAAIYRRWKSKLDMTIALISEVAVGAIDVPDTGTLHGDVREYLNRGREAVTQRLAGKIIPDLLAEGSRNPDLTSALLEGVRDPRRIKAAQLIHRAIKRGELPADTDIGLCLDFLAGPLYWRLIVLRGDIDGTYLDRLATKILAAMRG